MTTAIINPVTTSGNSKVTISISQRDFVDRLCSLGNKTTFVQLRSVTEPDMRKTNNRFYGLVKKASYLNGVINFDYQQMVNNARVRENIENVENTLADYGIPADKINNFIKSVKSDIAENTDNFVAAARKWGEHFVNPVTGEKSKTVITHKDSFYLQIAVIHTTKPVYMWNNGSLMTEEEIEEMKAFFPAKSEGETQQLEKPYIIRDYKLDNIVSVSMNKVIYDIK